MFLRLRNHSGVVRRGPQVDIKILSLFLPFNNVSPKSRDITLPTKVRLVKAIVFPVVMYGCESWTVKKAEH